MHYDNMHEEFRIAALVYVLQNMIFRELRVHELFNALDILFTRLFGLFKL